MATEATARRDYSSRGVETRPSAEASFMHHESRIGGDPVDPVNLSAALRTHVERLATEIGERNVFHPSALDAAREYITDEWRSQGYRVATTGTMLAGFIAPTSR